MAALVNVEGAIAQGRSQLGYTERPANRTKFGQWYGMDGVAWCAIFVSWCYAMAGTPIPATTMKGFSYVPSVVDWAKKLGIWKTSNPERGDLGIHWFTSRPDHVTIVQHPIDGGYRSLEGNTNAAGSRTGGMVAELNRRTRIHGYVDLAPLSAGPAVDWNTIRQYVEAVLGTLQKCPNINPRERSLYVSTYKAAFNIVAGTQLDAKNMEYDLSLVAAQLNFKRWMNNLGANIQDPDGYCHEGTRWWLCVALQNKLAGR